MNLHRIRLRLDLSSSPGGAKPEGPVCLSQKLKPRFAQEDLNEIRFNSRLLQAIASLPPPRKIGLETCSLGQGGEVALSNRRGDRDRRDETL
jgi:hypothetical protein